MYMDVVIKKLKLEVVGERGRLLEMEESEVCPAKFQRIDRGIWKDV